MWLHMGWLGGDVRAAGPTFQMSALPVFCRRWLSRCKLPKHHIDRMGIECSRSRFLAQKVDERVEELDLIIEQGGHVRGPWFDTTLGMQTQPRHAAQALNAPPTDGTATGWLEPYRAKTRAGCHIVT